MFGIFNMWPPSLLLGKTGVWVYQERPMLSDLGCTEKCPTPISVLLGGTLNPHGHLWQWLLLLDASALALGTSSALSVVWPLCLSSHSGASWLTGPQVSWALQAPLKLCLVMHPTLHKSDSLPLTTTCPQFSTQLFPKQTTRSYPCCIKTKGQWGKPNSLVLLQQITPSHHTTQMWPHR